MIAVFYHVYQHGAWRELVAEQRGLLLSSGLSAAADLVHVGVNGDEVVPFPHHRNPRSELEEADTLAALRDFATAHPEARLLYLHTKGVSRPSPPVTDWRRMMEYFCVERWRDCVRLLDEFDAVGCDLHAGGGYGDFPHFSGNVWWATGAYVQTLDASYLERPERLYREFWIGSGRGRLGELHRSGVDHYHEAYPPERYR